MKPTLEGFEIIKTAYGYGVTTIYDLFSLNTPKLLCEWPSLKAAENHKQVCFDVAMKEYNRCIKQGVSFPYND